MPEKSWRLEPRTYTCSKDGSDLTALVEDIAPFAIIVVSNIQENSALDVNDLTERNDEPRGRVNLWGHRDGKVFQRAVRYGDFDIDVPCPGKVVGDKPAVPHDEPCQGAVLR